MEYKITNSIMIILFIIVIGLGGMYIYKIGIGHSGVQNNQEQNINQGTTNKEPSTNTGTNRIKDTNSNNNYSGGDILIPPTSSSSTPSSTQKPSITHNAQNSKYYYNQLDEYSKVIYDAIVENIDNLKTGNCKIDINYDFSPLLSKSDGQNILDSYYKNTINALNLDIPDLFYIDFSKMSLNIEHTTTIFGTTYKLYINQGDNSNFFAEGFYSESQVTEIINKLENLKKQIVSNASGSAYNKILTIHDWIIDNTTYNGTSINRGTIYGTLIEKKSVCEGYARTLKYILDELGIENVLAVGVATNSNGTTEDHMWNYVKINGAWYGIDVTWDDPIVYGGGTIGYEVKHKYFLVGSTEIFKNHIENGNLSNTGKVFKFPTLSKNNYN